MLGIGPGEKGVSGVPGPPMVLVVPADVRFRMRALVFIGVILLDEPDVRDDFDCELESVGCVGWAGGGLLAALGALSFLENRPMSASVGLGISPQWPVCGLFAGSICPVALRRSAGGRTLFGFDSSWCS
jgi:hypothetical protein